MQRNRVKVSEYVRSLVPKIFVQHEVDQAYALLEEFACRTEDSDRIDLDILEGCDGKIEKMRELVNLANQDWRDLIMSTEYGLKGGKIVMNERGQRKLAELEARKRSKTNVAG